MSRCSQHSRDEHPASIVYSFLLQHGVISLSLKPRNAVATLEAVGKLPPLLRESLLVVGISVGQGAATGFSARAAEVVRGPAGGRGCGVYLHLEGAGEASRLILWIEEGRGVVKVK